MNHLFSTKLCCCLVAVSLVGGCVSDPDRANEQSGVVTGAVAGGLLGSMLGGGTGRGVATIIGAMVGGSAGGNIGRSMDQQARDRAERAYAQSMATSSRVHWESGQFTGDAIPASPLFWVNGRQCRRFVMNVSAGEGKRVQKIRGTACNYGRHGWLVVDHDAPNSKVMKSFAPTPNECHCHCP